MHGKFGGRQERRSAVVKTPDTDIFLILLHYAASIPINIYLDTGTGKNRKLVNVTELADSMGAEYCTAVLGLYVFTGEDVTSAFKGKGKVGPLKKMQHQPKYQQTFRLDFLFFCRFIINVVNVVVVREIDFLTICLF